MKKIRYFLLATFATAASCSPAQSSTSTEKFNIEVSLTNELMVPIFKEVASSFLKEKHLQDKVEVNFVYGDAEAISNSDVYLTNSNGLSALRGSKDYLPLNEKWSALAKANTGFEDDFKDGYTFMAFPAFNVPYTVLFYDSSVFNQNEIASWTELLEAAERKGTKVATPRHSLFDYLGAFNAFGVELGSSVDEKGQIASQTDTFDSENGMAAACALSSLYSNDNLVEFNYELTGISAFEGGVYNYDIAKRAYGDNLRVFARPKLDNGADKIDYPSLRVSFGFFVSKAIADNKKDTALELCAALTDKSVQAKLYEKLGPSYLPSNPDEGKRVSFGDVSGLLKTSIPYPYVRYDLFEEGDKLGKAIIEDGGQLDKEKLSHALSGFHNAVIKNN